MTLPNLLRALRLDIDNGIQAHTNQNPMGVPMRRSMSHHWLTFPNFLRDLRLQDDLGFKRLQTKTRWVSL